RLARMPLLELDLRGVLQDLAQQVAARRRCGIAGEGRLDEPAGASAVVQGLVAAPLQLQEEGRPPVEGVRQLLLILRAARVGPATGGPSRGATPGRYGSKAPAGGPISAAIRASRLCARARSSRSDGSPARSARNPS